MEGVMRKILKYLCQNQVAADILYLQKKSVTFDWVKSEQTMKIPRKITLF